MGQESRTKRIKHEIRKYCMNMSAHGVPRIAMSDHYCVKAIWSAVIMVCFGSFAYHANQIIVKFQRNDKIINIAMQFDVIPFPSVTICNTNPYKQMAALEVPELRRTMTMFENAAKEMKYNGTISTSPFRERRAFPTTRYIPGLTACDCPKHRAECFRRDGPPPNDTTANLCVCFYDQISMVPWPCYEKSAWSLRTCSACSSRTGTCPYPANTDSTGGGGSSSSAARSCICQDISNYCIAVDRSLSNSTLEDFLVNLWELTTTLASAPSSTEVYEFVEALGFQDVSDGGSLMAKGKENLAFVAATLNESVRVNISYQSGDIIKLCSFNGKECNIERDFSLHVDSTFGNCFTYNRYSNKTAHRSGPSYGLKVTAYLNPADYLQVTEAAGVRLIVHDHDEFPFPDTFGYNAPPGQLTSFGLQMKRIRRLIPPNGDCVTDQEGIESRNYFYKNHTYSIEGCYRSCVQNFILNECGCGDPRYPTPKGVRHCSVGDGLGRICVDGAFPELYASKEFGNRHCNCSQPCFQTVYSISISSAKWPVSVYQLPKDCTKEGLECLEEYRQNGAMIEVYYERISHELLVESQAFGWSSLMADFGGQLGLWMGASVITLTELIVLVWRVLLIFCEDRNYMGDAEAVPTEEPSGEIVMRKAGGRKNNDPSAAASMYERKWDQEERKRDRQGNG